MKKITLLLLIAVCALSNASAEKLYLKKSANVNYMADNALVAVWCWGGASSAWGVFQAVPNEADLAVADIPNGTTGIKIVRFSDQVQSPDWGAQKWNDTGDINKPADKNTIALNDWNGATNGTWTNYVSPDPSVELTIPSYSILNEQITFSATSENVSNPVYVYSVKEGEGEYTILQGNTWTPSVEGLYTIKVEVKEGTDGEILVSKEVTTTVVFKPEEITIQVQVPAEGLSAWTVEGGVYFYVWGEGMEGTFVQATAESDNWYTYTISTETVFPLNFIILNGPNWDAIKPEGSSDTDARRQTVNMENVVESACYIMVNGGETEGQSNWKKELNPAECPSEGGEPTAVEEVENAPLFSINGRMLNVALNNEAPIAIFTINGQLIENTVASNYTREMQQGVYVIRIGNQSQKLVIF